MSQDPLNNDATLVVFTQLPDKASAEALAMHLVAEHLAACVHLHAPCVSYYEWQGRMEQATEYPLTIKTTARRYDALAAAILELHPYELPELTYVHVDGGSPVYLKWVIEQTIETNQINK